MGLYLDNNPASALPPRPRLVGRLKGHPKTVAIVWSVAYALVFVGICFLWFHSTYAPFS